MARGELCAEGEVDARDSALDEAAAAFGIVIESEPEPLPDCEAFYLWPELVPTMRLWRAVQTQWRISHNGPTGLDYAGVEVVMRRNGIRGQAADEMFGQLQAAERATLDVWAEKKGKA